MFKKVVFVSLLVLTSNVNADTEVKVDCLEDGVTTNGNQLFKLFLRVSRAATPGTDTLSVLIYPGGTGQIPFHYSVPNGMYNWKPNFPIKLNATTEYHILNAEGNINIGPKTCIQK